MRQQLQGGDALVLRVGVREVAAYIAQGHGAEHGVHQRVERYVRVAVAQQPQGVGYLHTSQNQRAVRYQTVHVISLADAQGGQGR